MRRCDKRHVAKVLFLLCYGILPIFSWGPRGHRIVARIAEKHLTAESKSALHQILGHESLVRVANRADHLRSYPEWECTAPFHYASVEDGESYAKSPKDARGDIVQALEFFEAQLKDGAAALPHKGQAVAWLVHLVGDLHQPLHVGRACDRGGNQVEVEWLGKITNLHAVWDSGLIEAEELSFSEFAELLEGSFPVETAGSYAEWADEAVTVRHQIYICYGRDGCCAKGTKCQNSTTPFGRCQENAPFPVRLGYTYLEKNRKLLEQQLYRAGIRLAHVLNRALAAKTFGTAKGEKKFVKNPVAECLRGLLDQQ
ncbi:MAG: S1/P1 nuclease [Turneriella sp.]|nr:S1/P1 nuclease [Turneriella sp.]